MILRHAVTQYVTYKQTMGIRFATDERTLKSFCRSQGEKDLTEITPDIVLTFLTGNGPLTQYWLRKHTALKGFYRFVIAHGYVKCSPLPKTIPNLPNSFEPYIYSHEELKRLLEATTPCFEISHFRLDPATFRTLLLVLYGAALRISEALSLTLADVDLDRALLYIHESKFYRTRLVPFGIDLASVLSEYLSRRQFNQTPVDAPLFVNRAGNRLTRSVAERAFCRLREYAKVLRYDRARYQPRLHDLRHTAVTHRLLYWYRSGADVQRLLPLLATYLGHTHLSGTQHYLSLTPQLFNQASQRFENYAFGGDHE